MAGGGVDNIYNNSSARPNNTQITQDNDMEITTHNTAENNRDNKLNNNTNISDTQNNKYIIQNKHQNTVSGVAGLPRICLQTVKIDGGQFEIHKLSSAEPDSRHNPRPRNTKRGLRSANALEERNIKRSLRRRSQRNRQEKR